MLCRLRADHAMLLQRAAAWTSCLWSVAVSVRSADRLYGCGDNSTVGVPLPITAQHGAVDWCNSNHESELRLPALYLFRSSSIDLCRRCSIWNDLVFLEPG